MRSAATCRDGPAGHFVSWLALCPDNDVSGGKLLWRGARKVKTGLAINSVWPAYPLHHNLTPLGNYLHRMKAKFGPKPAAMAAAHKIAVIFYTMVIKQVEYDDTIWDAPDAQSENSLKANSNAKPHN